MGVGKSTRKFGKKRYVLKLDPGKLGDREHWKASEIKALVRYEIARYASDYNVKMTKYNHGKDIKVWVLPR